MGWKWYECKAEVKRERSGSGVEEEMKGSEHGAEVKHK